MKITALKRFMRKVDISNPDGCWVWIGYRNRYGYGCFGLNGVTRAAHRVIYGLAVAEIPPGMCVLHRCDNPACVRPSHLFIGTQADNMVDRKSKGRAPAGDAHRSSKLTSEVVGEIRRRYAAGGVSQRVLAREYGVSQQNISGIVAGYFWAAGCKQHTANQGATKMVYRRMIEERLAEIGSLADPRHVEGWMRLERGTLDALSPAEFATEVKAAAGCCADASTAMSEDLAQSFGL